MFQENMNYTDKELIINDIKCRINVNFVLNFLCRNHL